ncbi:MAG: trypsin-like peptidase domain-containing protein [Gordonia sp. (in: high G+C Gram-positive bacteria)]
MSDFTQWSAGSGADSTAPVLPTAPSRAPSVTPETAAVFGRPDGVAGSFSGAAPARRPQPEVAAPDPVLAEAFGRPAGSADSLQRDPYATYGSDDDESATDDPWRDPSSTAHLDRPALSEKAPVVPTDKGPKLGIGDVLLGRRVHWWALATLAIVAILIGLVGGIIGRVTAEVVAPLNSDSVSLDIDRSDSHSNSRIVQVAKAFAPSVVMIEVRTPGGGGTGSGFVVDPKGYIVTNNHVISMAANNKDSKLEVVFADHTRVPARIVGRDPKTDIAVVKVDNVQNLQVAKLGDSSKVEIGEEVIAFGAPLGLDRTVTSGIVSAVNRPVPLRPDADSDTDAVINAIQTDASINPGNSGGPLVDDQARVIGINTAGQTAGGGSIGLGFAIPINEVIPVVETLIKDGKIKHAQIGVSAATVRNDKVYGAQLRDVASGSPAAAAGLREGDVITSFDGERIEGADELTVAVRKSKINEQVKITYWRDGRSFDGAITPAGD